MCHSVEQFYLRICLSYNKACNAELGDIIDGYYHLRMNNKEILLLIELTYGFYLSMRQLKRILKSRGLRRRKNRSDLQEVCGCIKIELRKYDLP